MSNKFIGSNLTLTPGSVPGTLTVTALCSVLNSNNEIVYGADTPDAPVLALDTTVGYSDTISSMRSRILDVARDIVWRQITINTVFWLDDKGIL